MNESPLAGKTAVVTGAGRGIGKSIALTFARTGADLAICARSKLEIAETGSAVELLGRRCHASSVDLANPEQVEAFCHAVLREFGGVDILVNNAGAYIERGAFADSDPELWWRTVEVNLRGPYLLTRKLIEAIRPGGKIINLTSGKGFSAGADSTAYHVSKAALNMMTEGLANELWPRQIDVNSLVPGPTATLTNAGPSQKCSPEAILAAGRDALPKGLPAWERVKHPDEVADLALQLASYPVGGPTGQIFSLARRPL
ncbi:MAG: SDR family NAD(P)-dependent oxidoreductase [Rhodobacteraceae bacterium]|nr:SDR family NAD(P)-dependent oxidoreductase [Paracoccaceae bacterium]